MIIATNRILVKKGLAEKMALRFTTPGPLQQFPGFIKVETSITLNLEEHDELNVSIYWENLESFEAWKMSDIFKQAHNKPAEGATPSPIINNQIVVAKVATTLEAIPTV